MADAQDRSPMPLAVRAWFAWAFSLLAVTGLLLGRIVEFVDFSERAPFSLLGIFMMLEVAVVIFSVTVALQRKRVAYRLTFVVALLAVPVLAGLPPVLLDLPADAAAGWYLLTVPLGAMISLGLVLALLRRRPRAWFSED